MVAGCVTLKQEVTVGIERLWKAFACDNHNLLPKVLPGFFVSGEIVEGNGGAGTIKKFNFTPAVKVASFAKDHLEVVDHESHLLKYGVIEGGLIGQRLKSLKFEVRYEVSGNGGCVVKTKIEYDTLDDKPLSEQEQEELKGWLVLPLKATEAYLLANPSAYA
ncbi:pathogenesis-related protein 1-like [Phoenix dactylifera]|uniref:Pathogenesis-related protein 1-like n=1 Tax=Phoenix dactylifera TaxID=42345 RepID=A0A8B7CVD5_PHODC|nr:pathogenesis-related protein 1-like [Phoenix dactylifera]